MAATKRNAMLIAEARDKIRTTQLINRLQDHGDGKVDLSPTQVRAIEILLKKSMPDLQSIQLAGDPDAPLEVNLNDKRAAARALLDETFGEKPE